MTIPSRSAAIAADAALSIERDGSTGRAFPAPYLPSVITQ
jgi:hypothetical protein